MMYGSNNYESNQSMTSLMRGGNGIIQGMPVYDNSGIINNQTGEHLRASEMNPVNPIEAQ